MFSFELFLEKYALVFSIIVVLLELILGFMLLMKIKLKESIYALIALCVFFGFLTFYSAYFDVVTDCGCFGDALKFTPWQSFWKDITLLVLLIILAVLYRKREVSRKRKRWRKKERTFAFKNTVLDIT